MSQNRLFSFGVVADVQYADHDDGYNFDQTNKRYFRSALKGLRSCIEHWNKVDGDLSFSINLGDTIDGRSAPDNSKPALDAVMAELSRFNGKMFNILGNHEFYNFQRKELYQLLSNCTQEGSAYYSFTPHPRFRFIMLDTYHISVIGQSEGTEERAAANDLMARHNPNDHNWNSPIGLEGVSRRWCMFNGGLGAAQLQWLDAELTAAEEQQQKVVIFSHVPAHPLAADPLCILWDYEEALAVIRRHSCVTAWFSGHDHEGGYTRDETGGNGSAATAGEGAGTGTGAAEGAAAAAAGGGGAGGSHFVTLEAVLETEPGVDCFGRVDVYEDRLVLIGQGRLTSHEMPFDPLPPPPPPTPPPSSSAQS